VLLTETYKILTITDNNNHIKQAIVFLIK